jgi:hypothetical protein
MADWVSSSTVRTFRMDLDGTLGVPASARASTRISHPELEAMVAMTGKGGHGAAAAAASKPAVLRRLERAGLARVASAPLSAAERRQMLVLGAGTGRCGANLFRWMFDTHPRLCSPPQNGVIRWLDPLLFEVDSIQTLVTAGIPHAVACRKAGDWALRVFDDYAQRRGKKRTVSLFVWQYVLRLWAFDELFGGRVLWFQLFRHGLDYVDSAYRRFKEGAGRPQVEPWVAARGGNVHLGLADYWVAATRQMLAFAEMHPERTCRIPFEELTSKPESTMKRAFAFVGEPWVPGLVERAFKTQHEVAPEHQQHEIAKSKSVDPNRVGRWKKWPSELLRQVAPIVNDTMAAAGYEPA